MLLEVLLVFAGGGLGALARWWLSSVVQKYTSPFFPWGTLAVNLLGSLLLGFIMEASAIYGVFTRQQRLLLATGFCGGFTTFSTFSYETFSLLAEGPSLYALANIALNVLGGLAAVYLGMVAARAIYARP